MADKKISALTSIGTDIATGDLLHVIDTSGTYTNKNMTIGNMFQNIPTWLGLSDIPQTLTNDNDVSVTTSITYLDSNTAALDNALPDGSQGQIKIITMTVAGNNAVVTPTNRAGYASITFDAVGESVILLFTNSAWTIIGSYGATVA